MPHLLWTSTLSAHFFLPPNRHLSDPTHRQTYESAHSVILAAFVSHAQRQQQDLAGNCSPRSDPPQQASSSPPAAITPNADDDKQKKLITGRAVSDVIYFDAEAQNFGSEGESDPASSEESRLSATFEKYMVPFYAKCHIDVRIWFFWSRCVHLFIVTD